MRWLVMVRGCAGFPSVRSMKHAPRVVAEHPSGAARHGGNASFLPCAPHVPPLVADDPEHGGGRGLGGTPSKRPPPRASPSMCLGAFTCLYRSGWARRVRRLAAGGLFGPPTWECLWTQHFWGGTFVQSRDPSPRSYFSQRDLRDEAPMTPTP